MLPTHGVAGSGTPNALAGAGGQLAECPVVSTLLWARWRTGKQHQALRKAAAWLARRLALRLLAEAHQVLPPGPAPSRMPLGGPSGEAGTATHIRPDCSVISPW